MSKRGEKISNLVTIMVPTYNRLDKLKKCMSSIVNQTCLDFDLVISDNASTDGTKEYLSKFSWPNTSINFSTKNNGLIQNHEKCIEMSKSEWVVFVSDDDLLEPDFILNTIDELRRSKASIVLPGFYSRDFLGNKQQKNSP